MERKLLLFGCKSCRDEGALPLVHSKKRTTRSANARRNQRCARTNIDVVWLEDGESDGLAAPTPTPMWARGGTRLPSSSCRRRT